MHYYDLIEETQDNLKLCNLQCLSYRRSIQKETFLAKFTSGERLYSMQELFKRCPLHNDTEKVSQKQVPSVDDLIRSVEN